MKTSYLLMNMLIVKKWMKLVYENTVDDGSFWLNVGYMPIKEKGKAIPISYLLWDKTIFS
ncbi:site-specific DNA-methyltransferase [Streptococcus equi]|uniref:site-specific DNA-methyltransferase n=1 Tax=Streptococcus equi TaxID=1336 RepID=UPI001E509946|nr:site-specific DNA-methyltransferase [Streptococcus equi]MCD3403722.1 site-specific DNA-methyltransferase [Streptococcus equi subsp. zooepidemicus]